MTSTSNRKLATSRITAPLLALWMGACGDAPASSASDTEGGTTVDTTGASTTDTPTTAPPTTGDETGVPAESEGRYFLRIDDTPPPPVVLEMDKAKSLEIFGEKAAKQIKLLDVDSTPLLAEVLARIQGSCGDRWKDYDYVPKNPPDPKDPNIPSKKNISFPNDPNSIPSDDLPVDPRHDCSLTELGKTYGADWRHSPQFAMVRLLTMTPRNAVVKGTVLEDFELLFTIFDGNAVNGFTFVDVLAASLYCGADPSPKDCTDRLKDSKVNQFGDPADKLHEIALHTQPFISTEILADTLKTTLLKSHPNIANDQGLLPVTLYDALKDMQPLSEKFGPVGDHPGVLMPDDASFTTRSDALTPVFKMVATAESNLRRVEGIDVSVGSGEMFISIAKSPLAFDFLDADKVQLLGIAEAPTVDMRMRIMELPGPPIPACDGVNGHDTSALCQKNLPNSPVTGKYEYIWSQPLWSLERIVGEAAFATFKDLSYPFYCFAPGLNKQCVAGASVGDGGVDGWTFFHISQDTGLAEPPKQFFWELLLGVAQVAVHDPVGDNSIDPVNNPDYDPNATKNDIPEGEANPIFALKSLPIGLTAEEMIAQIRPNLQNQADFIANVILGKFWKHNDHLDFYYRRATDTGGVPTLFFVSASDLRPDPSDPEQLDKLFGYANPGFFADEKLANKLSSTVLPGVADTEHEKLQLPEGDTTVYMQDDEGRTYRLRFFVPAGGDPTEIVVHVRPV